jgi:hypothetical protein
VSWLFLPEVWDAELGWPFALVVREGRPALRRRVTRAVAGRPVSWHCGFAFPFRGVGCEEAARLFDCADSADRGGVDV